MPAVRGPVVLDGKKQPMYNRVTRWAIAVLVALVWLTGCATATPNSPTLLNPGNYTPLGGVQKNNQPTTSDYASLQAAESGTLNQPAFVEFYADY